MFPLTPGLRAILERQLGETRALEREADRIIPWLLHRDGQPIKAFRRTWLTACRKAGVPGRLPHDFRRTAVRNLERAGVPRSAAMKMVGHKTESIYRRYAIADEAMAKESAEKLARLHQADQAAGGATVWCPWKRSSMEKGQSTGKAEVGMSPSRAGNAGKDWWTGGELNSRHRDFQSRALPTELPVHPGKRPIPYQTPRAVSSRSGAAGAALRALRAHDTACCVCCCATDAPCRIRS